MSTEKTSIENENQPSCLGAVSGSFLFDKALLDKAIIKPLFLKTDVSSCVFIQTNYDTIRIKSFNPFRSIY